MSNGALIAVSFGSFFATVVIHALLCRLPILIDRVTRFLAAGIAVAVVVTCYLFWIEAFSLPGLLGAVLVYGFCCEMYIFLFTMNISSISSNLLVRALLCPIELSEIDRIYDSKKMVDARLERLTKTGFLVSNGGCLTITSKGALFTKILRSLRGFFRHS